MSASERRSWIIHGRVQGVFFRASTAEQARPLGLNGSAVNLPDGSVRVVAEGTAQALDQLEAWLQHGPDRARVDAVESEPAPDSVPTGFVTG